MRRGTEKLGRTSQQQTLGGEAKGGKLNEAIGSLASTRLELSPEGSAVLTDPVLLHVLRGWAEGSPCSALASSVEILLGFSQFSTILRLTTCLGN